MSNCGVICQTCLTTCESFCETSCLNCMGRCETTCENSCQTSCLTGCQSTCERACQTARETNVSPTVPGSISVPSSVQGGQSLTISWGASSDTNLSGYRLQRSVDNGTYTQIFQGNARSYTDTITRGWETVRYRVQGYDPYTSSSWRTSNIVTVINNAAPIISGSDLDLGAKVDNFQIEYIVTDNDSGDEVSVEIRVNNNVIQDFTRTSLGIKRFIDIDLDNYDLGKNTVTITARDKAGLTATRVYVFTKTNTAPEISSTDTDLGAKNTPFSITYQVRDREGDSVTVYEKINGDILRTRTNVTLDSDLTITVSAEMLQELEIGKINTIEIEASDGKGGTAYRRYTFKRTNFPPTISGNDTDLGEFSTEFSYTWSATDTENDGMTATVFFDGVVHQSERDIVDSENYTITFDGLDFLKIRPGKHTIRILVVDAQGGKSERVVGFTRVANRLVMQQAEVYESDLAAQRITVVPNTKVTLGANEKIEVTNNGFDENPTWEDATSMINAGKAYNFTNAAKTATKWGVDTRITIELGEDAQPLQSYIMGWGLSYE